MNLPELLQLSSSYWSACTLHAGVKLDIFSCLSDQAMTAADLAQRISADERGLAMLLNGLTAMELLQKEGDLFRCTEFSSNVLSKKSAQYMGHIILHHHNLVAGWSRLDEAVKQGGPVRNSSSHGECEQQRENFLLGMFNLASLIAPQIAQQVDLKGRHRLLDLAGGPGTYAIHFCQKYPDLQAVIIDLPTTRPFAEDTVQRFGLSDRITFAAADILSDDLGSGFDLVWISHLLHSESPDNSQKILHKAVKALNPGGLLLIQEFVLDDDRTAPLFPALFSLNMLVGTTAGQAYSQQELVSMMSDAGLSAVRRLPLSLPNGSGVLAGEVR